MDTEIKKLECSIGQPGTPFNISEAIKDTTFPPGTSGFLSYVVGPDHNNPNIVFQQVVTTRRGKKGKSRINNNMILSPIFTIPGVDINKLTEEPKDKKYFVDLELETEQTIKIIGENILVDDNFLAWSLAKSLFVIELDKIVFPKDHKIIQILGVNDKKSVVLISKDEPNKIKRLVDNLELYYNDNAVHSIIEEFSNEEAKTHIFNKLKMFDILLLIPKLEYQRKVCDVMTDALVFLNTQVEKLSDKDIKDKKNIINIIETTKKQVLTKRQSVVLALDIRLAGILKNRDILNI